MKEISEIEPEHLDWQEYERAARINLKSLKIQIRTCEDMIKSAREMMAKTKKPEKTKEESKKIDTKENDDYREKIYGTI